MLTRSFSKTWAAKELFVFIVVCLGSFNSIAWAGTNDLLGQYRAGLAAFRNDFGGTRHMPGVEFFLFGMGNRTKLIYSKGALREAMSGRQLRHWDVAQETIIPSAYRVELHTRGTNTVVIQEDEDGVWIEENEKRLPLQGTQTKVILPAFEQYKYSEVLKVLHQEILINILDGKPLPNFLVYANPWRRDAAMMAMCLEKTGNLDLIRTWVMGLKDPYDHNNKANDVAENEADNLGETLYLVSLFSNKHQPIIWRIRSEVARFYINDGQHRFILGRTDFHQAPVYQTKWLKFGLRSLGMYDPFTIPPLRDDYSSLFWWDFKESDVEDSPRNDSYPYLSWARDHYFGKKRSPISDRDYPLTWETNASQANYEWMASIDPELTAKKTAMPHSWHAAEVFLYALEFKK